MNTFICFIGSGLDGVVDEDDEDDVVDEDDEDEDLYVRYELYQAFLTK